MAIRNTPLGEWLLPNMSSPAGIKKGKLAGAVAAAYLGGSFLLTVLLTGHPTLGEHGLTPTTDADVERGQIAIVVLAAAGWFIAAYRLIRGKGRIAIWFVLAYAAYSLVTRLAFAPPGPGAFISLLAVGAAVSGVRATLADRNRSMAAPSEDSAAASPQNLWRRRSWDFRLWVFGSVVWAAATILCSLVLHGIDGLEDLSDRQLRQIWGVMLLPPIFSGVLWFGYKRLVR